jgi:hypothetical protein
MHLKTISFSEYLESSKQKALPYEHPKSWEHKINLFEHA